MKTETYNVFVRTWWKENKSWPNGLEPHMGRKTFLAYNLNYEDAILRAKQYNDSHNPGRYSRKAEISSK